MTHYDTIISLMCIIDIMTILLPKYSFLYSFLWFLHQLFPTRTVSEVLMTKAKCQCLLARKLLLRHLSKLHHHQPVPALCVTEPWHSSARFLFQRLYVTWQVYVTWRNSTRVVKWDINGRNVRAGPGIIAIIEITCIMTVI